MNDLINQLIEALNKLGSLPVNALTFILCIGVAEFIRRSRFSNRIIPGVCILVSVVFTFGLVDPKDVPASWSFWVIRGWLFRNIATATISGMGAHYLHWKVLANEKSKVPLIGGVFTGSGNSNPDNRFDRSRDGINFEDKLLKKD